MDLTKILKLKYISYVISFILGIGLTGLFKRKCGKNNCIKYVGPKPEKLLNTVYKHNNKCYSFNYQTKPCKKANKIIPFA